MTGACLEARFHDHRTDNFLIEESSSEEQTKGKSTAPAQAAKKLPVTKKWEGEDEDDDGPAVSLIGLTRTTFDFLKLTFIMTE